MGGWYAKESNHLRVHTTLPSNLQQPMYGFFCDALGINTCSIISLNDTADAAAAMGGVAPVQMLYGEHKSSQNPHFYRWDTTCITQNEGILTIL